MAYHTPLSYPTHGEAEPPYGAVVSTGMPSFAPPTPILPQYNNVGRMQPEFLDNSVDTNEGGRDDRPIIARGHITKIFGYAPREGTHNTRILVRLLFRQDRIPPGTRVSLRVKMGNIPLMTSIQGIESVEGVGGEWRLHVVAPDPVELNVAGLEVPLIVQTLDVVTATIIDDVCIGPFRFLEHGPANADAHSMPQPPYSRDYSLDDTISSGRAEDISRLAVSHSLDDSDATSELQDIKDSVAIGSTRKRAQLSIEVPPNDSLDMTETASPDLSSPTITRSLAQSSQNSGENTYSASLKVHGDLNSMTENWTPEEVMNGRRMVEFFCVQTRGCINIEFAPVSGEDARNVNKIVASCIRWEDMDDFFITSVDAISLLEKLVGTRFTTEEKNRIRRNLQGFKPATVSKSHPDSKAFFQLIMGFPAPRPRNIEKDVKAFRWSKLPNMLEKVISKYWFVASPGGSDSEDQDGSPRIRVVRDLDNTPGESPSAVGLPLSASHTPSPPQSLQADARQTRTGVLPGSESFMPSPSSAAGDHDPFHAGSLENSTYPDGPGMSQGTLIYGTLDPLMEISDSSMNELRSFPMGQDHMAPEYHEQGHVYPEAMEVSHPTGFYSQGAGVNEMAGGEPHNMHYMAHTSHEYA